MLIDSNILVYAINLDSPRSGQARVFLQKNEGNFCIAHQNVMETLRILTHPKAPLPMPISSAVAEVGYIVEAGYIIFPNRETLELATDLIGRYKISGRKIFDAYLAATMLSNGENVIATDNESDFAHFNGIKVINPFK